MCMTAAIEVLVVDVERGGIRAEDALGFVSDPSCGGITLFVGRVRDHSQGLQVNAVLYDMFEPLTLKVLEVAAHEAQVQWGPARIFVAHARGHLGIGDVAVVVAVGTAHRDEAFRACRAVIEAVKHRAPIWKKEIFTDGESEWSEGCSLCDSAHTHAGDDSAARHEAS